MANSRAGEESLTPTQWKQFFAAWLGYLLDGFDFLLITLVLTEVADEFDLDLVTASTLVSAAFVSRWFGGLLLGAIGDRFGRQPAMVISILCFSIGSFLCGLSWGYWSLFVFRAIVGLGMAGEYASSVTYAMESWPKRFRNRASGALLSAYPIGVVLASQLYAVVVPHLGWRWMFFIGLVPAFVAWWMRRTLPEAQEWQNTVGSSGASRTTMQLLFSGGRRQLNIGVTVVAVAVLVLIFSRTVTGLGVWPLAVIAAACFYALARQIAGKLTPMFVMLVVTVLAAFLYSWPTQSLLPTYLKTELHFDPGQVSRVLLWAGLGYAAGSVISGVIADRLGTRRTYVLGLVISLAFVVPVFALDGAHIVWLWVLIFGLQFTSQGISGLLPKFLSDHLPVNVRASSLGFCYNIGALGGAVAPIAGASIAESIGLGNALMVLTLSFTALVAVLVGFDIPRRFAPKDLEKEEGVSV
ncbi:MFS transporter [Mycolicibacterium smegmatis]|uniref:Sialic acid transporter n=3 Tax=Mycolicibacterium smegmatis TaxID=1772 RepID=A0QQU0_MYCS2|nr:MFS transporter [Mycolicibacterium smegmatis]ABK71571.1 putative sialic acid transporter [Mycolicibacterium smegmatis MC2 155]AFP37335.1 MFS family sialic acid transporter [Mycolicibacterium smegmatis MC2 155]AIU06134.1 sialic acid transporter [Mycolicibacterium smegmatis MC2 155]AIU12759.1 sialic acid transporter [Mycolicibacterium smegmatis]AIU19383.1 sialic acid transporter [Mycolicibacterium smegmatis]